MYQKFNQKIVQLLQKAKSHEGFLRYAKNTSWLMGEKILRMFMALFVGIWVARYLGPEQFGLLSYAQSFVFLFTAIATLGLDSIVVRELVKDPSQRDVLLGTAFTLKLIGAVVILPLLWFGVQFTDNDSTTNLLIFITAGATIFQSFNVIDFYYQSTVMSKYVALTNTICLMLSSIIKVMLIMNQASLVAFAWMSVFDAFVVMAGLVYFYGGKTGHRISDWLFDWKKAKQLLVDSFPMLFGSLSFVIFSNVDVIMLKHFTNDFEVGLYSASYRLSTLWYFFPGMILSSLMPSVIAVKDNPIAYQYRTTLITRFLVWISIIIAIIISVLSDFILKLTYGMHYDQASPILVILIWVNVFIFFNSAWNYWQIAEGKERSIFYFHFLVAISNIVFNLFLIPRLGVLGAGIAIIISLVFTTLLFVIYDKSTRQLLQATMFLRVLK